MGRDEAAPDLSRLFVKINHERPTSNAERRATRAGRRLVQSSMFDVECSAISWERFPQWTPL